MLKEESSSGCVWYEGNNSYKKKKTLTTSSVGLLNNIHSFFSFGENNIY